jgi:hypothetical protein
MMNTEMIEPRIEGRFHQAAKFLIEARAMHGALPNEPTVAEVLTDLAIAATHSGEHAQVVQMIDDPDIRPHLRADFIIWRSAFAKVAEQPLLIRRARRASAT